MKCKYRKSSLPARTKVDMMLIWINKILFCFKTI